MQVEDDEAEHGGCCDDEHSARVPFSASSAHFSATAPITPGPSPPDGG
jgi:hypothetical protein